MNSRQSRSGSRRRRRGGRNHSSSPRSSGDTFHVRREPRKPAGLWDKIKAFFGISAPAAAPSSSAQRRDREAPAARPPRAERAEPRQRTPREPRKPEAVEVTTPRLYIGNLSYDAAESDLFELFSGVGTVVNVEIIANKNTHRSKGFGFVQMTSVTEAKRAVDDLHDKEYMGRKLVVSGAKLPPDRPIGREREEVPDDSAPSPDAEEESTTPTA